MKAAFEYSLFYLHILVLNLWTLCVDKRKNVGKLLATAVSLSMACPSCPKGLELVPKGIVHKSIGR
jgi:hypothetical protein